MNVVNAKTIQQLEFDKFLSMASQLARSEEGQSILLNKLPSSDQSEIQLELLRVDEIKHSQMQDSRPHFNDVMTIEGLETLRVSGATLEAETLHDLALNLESFKELEDYFLSRVDSYNNIAEWWGGRKDPEELIKSIRKLILEDGSINYNASPELKRIQRHTNKLKRETDAKFQSELVKAQESKILAGSGESIRNGRRVLAVKAEAKRKIQGILHDESATGKTAFLEPAALVELHNQIVENDNLFRRELHKLIVILCNELGEKLEEIDEMYSMLIQLDVWHAKAQMGIKYDGVKVELSDQRGIIWKNAFHPLLKLRYQEEGRKVVPFDLTLNEKQRILVISGPNAGGKSVLMKAVGLLQLMVQSGFLVPADEDSQLGIFETVSSDIGDQQSIENDLSTYSSHLSNMSEILKESGSRSLTLIDEMGSGTDPQLGGALAEAMLHQLNRKGSFGIMTTHFPNLKMYAHKMDGLVNGSMGFNRKNLSPNYQLTVGEPGSSFALEIAEKSGLDSEIIKRARKNAGDNYSRLEEMLAEVTRLRDRLKTREDQLVQKEQMVERLGKSYDSMAKDLEARRIRIKKETRQAELEAVAAKTRELENLVRQLTEERNLEKAKELLGDLKGERQNLGEELTELYSKARPGQKQVKVLKPGDHVRIIDSDTSGEVVSVKGKRVQVRSGHMTLSIPFNQLEPIKEPIGRQNRSISYDYDTKTQDLPSKLDIRGMRKEEALKLLQDYLDRALVSQLHSVEVIHGKGNGVLRKALIHKLKDYPGIRYEHPSEQGGGMGKTIVFF